MDQLSSFLENNPKRLFLLAKALHEKSFFEKFLNDFQFQIVKFVLDQDNFELWKNLLEGNCSLVIDSSDEKELDLELEGLEDGVKPITMLALNMRYLLWEKAIDFFFLNDSREIDTEDYDLIALLDNESEVQQDVANEKEPVRDEEDDYDDEEEDEENEKDKNGLGLDPGLERNLAGQVIVRVPRANFSTKTLETEPAQAEETIETAPEDITPATASLEEQDVQIKNFNKIYHDFEYDRETLIKRRKLEKSDMQLEDPKIQDDENSSIPISLGVASHSLKHLLNTIQDRRETIGLSDFELRSLFMDVRKNRGKWANDDRVGQEELYESCEKVLLDLRGYTEHSTPFLNKVSKREAPNYGLIIKKPMDLNTVMKKLKNLSYNSKQEFVDDLNLIWNNCLIYNADPKHFLRAHALAMQKRAQRLAPSIPDIVIRNRADIEKDDELENDGRGSTPAIKGGKMTSKKGRMRRREEIIKAEETEGVSDVPLSEAPSADETPAPIVQPDLLISESAAPEENGEEEDDEGEEADTEMREGNDDDVQDAELQAWKNLTAKSRANYCAARSALFDELGRLKMDADAIIRESKKMSDFNQFLDNKEVVSKGNKLLDNDEPYLLEYDICGGIPGITYRGEDDASQEKYENEMVEAILKDTDDSVTKKTGLVLRQDTGLNGLYTKNITNIQEIRKICFKISLIRQMQTQQFMHRTQMRQPEIDYLKEVDIDPVSKLPNHDINDSQVQFAALRRSMAKIAMHTGFETTQPFAINTLTQVAERYMLNLAKSMKLHCESATKNTLQEREVILLTLLENGVEKPDDLYTFIQEKALKNQAKLEDLRRKLSGFLKDLLRPSLESFSENSFEDNSEQFTTGDFTSELGDDFFGFKELGLDKEFKMLTSSVPVYLLHSRLHSSFNNSGPASKTSKYEDLRDWKTKKLTKLDADKQIGLLRPFYQELVQKTEAFYVKQQKRKGESTELPSPANLFLMEDEELPQKQRNIRPRLPPTGKISAVKKKIVSTAYILPDEEEQAVGFNGTFSLPLDEIKTEA